MWTWLNTYASAVQAITAIIGLVGTIVLIVITARYVALTRALAKAANAQLEAEDRAARARRGKLKADISLLSGALNSLPEPSQRNVAREMIRTSHRWDKFDFDKFRMLLAAEISDHAGECANVIESNMRRLADIVDSVRTPYGQIADFDWSTFKWDEWNRLLHDARTAVREMSQELGK